MSSESGPDERKEPTLGSETPKEDEAEATAETEAETETEVEAAQEVDPAETLANTEPDRLPPWLGMPEEEVKVSRFSPGMIAQRIR